MHQRTQKACLLIGAGGTGKTTIILELVLKVFVLYFPAHGDEDRYFILTFSHAQGAAISNDIFRAQTAHNSVEYRVASLRNKDLALRSKAERCQKKWAPKVLLIEDEVSLFPAMVQNMLLFRGMKSRQNIYDLRAEEYNTQGNLFGHMPIVIVAGDFLQIKPAKEISLADDLDALKEAGKKIHPEHSAAQDAILEIQDVIELTKSKRFTDTAMPSLMEALRSTVFYIVIRARVLTNGRAYSRATHNRDRQQRQTADADSRGSHQRQPPEADYRHKQYRPTTETSSRDK